MDMTQSHVVTEPNNAGRNGGHSIAPKEQTSHIRKPMMSSELFGRLTFSRKVMMERLSKSVYDRMRSTIDNNEPLDPEIATDVAHAMKEWAVSMGATHFCHWFQPQRGCTAEKHDSFLGFDEQGCPIEQFSGKQLSQGEPDASSFPSGGIRSTFEARGYTAWDPTSPAFILKMAGGSSTLVIPSVFLSWTGEVLDRKTPLLRSLRALEERAYKVLRLFGNRSALHIRATMGPEQEYFLIPKNCLDRRTDLFFTGRTLMGMPSAKNQQLEDHYLGEIKPRVMSFMADVDAALWEQGIPAKTRHNEVAPNQFEIAPIFEESNLSCDHNLQQMEIMRRIADMHGMAILFHEKPFAGINGSGKHMNWSLADSDGNNLLEPGEEPRKNMQFLVFLCAILHGVNKYGALLRASVADAGNDHRLGANEAPPAIMSVYLGGYLTDLLSEIEKGKLGSEALSKAISHGLQRLPGIMRDNSDRNRTSPIAFTGDKFEFRAVGSSQSVSDPAMVMAMIVADGLDVMLELIEKRASKNGNFENAVLAAIKEVYMESKNVCYEGNNYSPEWQKESLKRGLANCKDTPTALKALLDKDVVELFGRYGVLSKNELIAMHEIKLGAYVKTKEIELRTIKEMADTYVLPAVMRHVANLGAASAAFAGGKGDGGCLASKITACGQILKSIDSGAQRAMEALVKSEGCRDLEKRACQLASEGNNALESLRDACDKAEGVVEHALWPFPKCREMLFML